MVDHPFATLLIPCHNESENLDDTLGAALAPRYPADYEVIAIDDGSSDDTGSARPLSAFSAKRPLSRVKNGLLPNHAVLLIWLYSTSPKASTLSFRRKVPLA
ncbi:hypothetical protein G6F64_015168 [Rhizopus arrhizus]|uniref:Glycosyltransferase 2-like domain-containing protein n=1 Tax=Rhizopus oryzae TaxID=64495 RepID=A0A9P7BJ35_RHIOR|nr:hypothetical protein G6F64_015168 [Rhizopus arrhizus]